MRGSSLKSWFMLAVFRAGNVLPASFVKLGLRIVIGVLIALYWMPLNPVRRSCRNLARLAARQGLTHSPFAIYRRLLGQLGLVLRGFVDAFQRGRDATMQRVRFGTELGERMAELRETHGGVVLAVPHNVCSIFCALSLPKDSLVLVVRNRKGRHNVVSQRVIERMELTTLEVRDLSPIALSRGCMKALGESKILVATVDNSYRKPDAVEIDVFGLPKGFGPWAARIAARRGTPVVPCYPRVENGVVGVWLGEPMIDADPERLMRHYVAFFEGCILRDPGSWAFLGDKRWGAHIARACELGGPGAAQLVPA